ncbi:MAG: efflux RND transporter periplasmic adaptor subunit [Candidatus Nealsonbacteria bacterium]
MKKIILISIVVITASAVIFNVFLKKKDADFTLIEAVKGSIIQEVSETGQVQMGRAVNLGFKNAGTLQKVFVKVGDDVWPGSSLAKLDTVQLMIERAEAQAALEVAQAKLDQLLEGSSAEEVQAAQTDVQNAQIALDDTKQKYDENVSQAYEDALNILDSAYLKTSGALNTVNTLKKTYFSSGDQESNTVNSKKISIETSVNILKIQIDQAHASSTNQNIDNSLVIARSNLNNIYAALNIIREMTETINYASVVSAADKTSLNTERTNINTALSGIINAQQTISLAKINGQTDVNTAQGNLKETQDDLALKLAKPSRANTDLYQAQVNQAKAGVDLLDNKISEATLKSPVQGQVTKISRELGETVQPSLSDSVITLLPKDPYEIEVNIYEEDVVKVKFNDPVEIKLPSFPNQIFSGKVVAINPAEELVEGVIYYKVTISFENPPQDTKPGMSADITIKTAEKHDILTIPGLAVTKKGDKTFVQIFKDKKLEEIEIRIGLRGNNDAVEIISGLIEGEQVAIQK